MKYSILAVLLLLVSGLSAQDKFTISGSLTDASSGEDLIGAAVVLKSDPARGAVSNIYGFYSFTLEAGEHILVYSFVGYKAQEISFTLTQDETRNVALGFKDQELKVFEVTAEKEDANVTNTDMGVSRLDIAEISKIPVLFGEKDVIKTIQLLPSVKSAGEGSTGFYVRGGSSDQNLILLDESPVYNASHLLGFFSVFNSDAIKDIQLYTGSIPAEYGGRLSSVMDIRMKDGNNQKMVVKGSVGLISSKLSLEAPIQQGKSSFMITARRTYADVFLKATNDFKDNQLYFYDLNAKANFTLNENNRVFLSGYFGRDVFKFGDDFGFNWGNATGTVRWNHIYNPRLFSNTSVIYSNYDYEIEADAGSIAINSVVEDWNLKQDFNYYLNNKITVDFGGNVIYHDFDPGSLSVTSGEFHELNSDHKYSLESALYVSSLHKVSPRVALNYGLRYNNFSQYGPGDIYSFTEEGDVSDITTYERGDVVKNYGGLAPRFSSTYMLSDESSLKAAYTRTYQYLHLLSNSTGGTPVDVWLPTSNNIKPEIADQVSVGYFHNWDNNAYEFSVESYYKEFQNSIDYRAGVEVNLNPEVEGGLLYGKGRAYGIEFLLKKKKGRFTGWMSYTLAKSERSIDGINGGAWYNAKQDRTHDVALVGMYQLNERSTISATWVYYTGNAVTFPAGTYNIGGEIVNYYGLRNQDRMPAYHRMDIGYTWDAKNVKEVMDPTTGEVSLKPRKVKSSWNASVYNLYGRENAYSILFEDGVATRTALFKWIPSISWSFEF